MPRESSGFHKLPTNLKIRHSTKGRSSHLKLQVKYPPRSELGSPDSEFRVLTITPWNH